MSASLITSYIGIGANLGEPQDTVVRAAKEIASLPGVLGTRLSPLYRSAPVDSSGPDYVNAVLKAETNLAADTLLRALQAIEDQHGRLRPYRNAPRSLDLDLLLHGAEQHTTDFLTLPHPRMHLRAFVLLPLRDLAPDIALPQGNLEALLAACRDQRVERIT